jgi:hypothetical protein
MGQKLGKSTVIWPYIWSRGSKDQPRPANRQHRYSKPFEGSGKNFRNSGRNDQVRWLAHLREPAAQSLLMDAIATPLNPDKFGRRTPIDVARPAPS